MSFGTILLLSLFSGSTLAANVDVAVDLAGHSHHYADARNQYVENPYAGYAQPNPQPYPQQAVIQDSQAAYSQANQGHSQANQVYSQPSQVYTSQVYNQGYPSGQVVTDQQVQQHVQQGHKVKPGLLSGLLGAGVFSNIPVVGDLLSSQGLAGGVLGTADRPGDSLLNVNVVDGVTSPVIGQGGILSSLLGLFGVGESGRSLGGGLEDPASNGTQVTTTTSNGTQVTTTTTNGTQTTTTTSDGAQITTTTSETSSSSNGNQNNNPGAVSEKVEVVTQVIQATAAPEVVSIVQTTAAPTSK